MSRAPKVKHHIESERRSSTDALGIPVCGIPMPPQFVLPHEAWLSAENRCKVCERKWARGARAATDVRMDTRRWLGNDGLAAALSDAAAQFAMFSPKWPPPLNTPGICRPGPGERPCGSCEMCTFFLGEVEQLYQKREANGYYEAEARLAKAERTQFGAVVNALRAWVRYRASPPSAKSAHVAFEAALRRGVVKCEPSSAGMPAHPFDFVEPVERALESAVPDNYWKGMSRAQRIDAVLLRAFGRNADSRAEKPKPVPFEELAAEYAVSTGDLRAMVRAVFDKVELALQVRGLVDMPEDVERALAVVRGQEELEAVDEA